jgi:exonuclease III
MKAIAYNCRGLGNQPTVQGLLELWKAEDPDVLFLSETKLDKEGMMRIKVLLGMPNMEVKNCEGRSGGLALLWKKDVNLVVSPGMSRYHIDAVVTGEDGFTWRLMGIYGEPQTGAKEKTWKPLRILHGRSSLPWICFGDFNEILFASEKQGGQSKKQACMEKFRMTLEFCELEDLGFMGDPYTWRNHSHRADTYIKERLDRSIANLEWRTHFPAYKAINGDPRHSDHRPVIVVMDPEPHSSSFIGVREQPKFEACWLEEEQCEEVVHNAWHLAFLSSDVAVADAIRRVGAELHS